MHRLPISRLAARVVVLSFGVGLITFGHILNRPMDWRMIIYLFGLAAWVEVATLAANTGPDRWQVQWLVSTGTSVALCLGVWLSLDYFRVGPMMLALYVPIASFRLGLRGGLYVATVFAAFLAGLTRWRPDAFTWFDWVFATLSLYGMAVLMIDVRNQSLAGLTDPLTGLHNRRGLDQYIRERFSQFEQAAVVLCDLDGLKQVNDTQGHAAGDRMLIQVSHTFLQHLRGSDFACRLGGDEFLLVLVESGAGEAEAVLEQIRAVLEGQGGVTASFGVALYPRDGHTLREVMAAADGALYEAKRKRNAVSVARAAGQ